jgi:hypothetical protein
MLVLEVVLKPRLKPNGPPQADCAFSIGLRLMHTLIFKDQICNPASAGPLSLI